MSDVQRYMLKICSASARSMNSFSQPIMTPC